MSEEDKNEQGDTDVAWAPAPQLKMSQIMNIYDESANAAKKSSVLD